VRTDVNQPMSRPYVLDVGSGYAPDPRAEVLVDKFLRGTVSRYAGGIRIFPGQYMICADAEALPFIDGAFDFALCYQTLEHVDDPDVACQELVRVASAGFITAPSETATKTDIIVGLRPYHKWLIKQEPHSTYGTRLRFIPRDRVLDDLKRQCQDRHVIMFWIGEFTWEVES
jgi:SAM-dependent methyltransferase